MPKMKLRVGVIGTGAIADEKHLPNWQELEAEGRVELIGACDILPARAEEMAAKYGARVVHTDYKKMLSDGQYDIIDVREKSLETTPFIVARETHGERIVPGWLEVLAGRMRILVHQLPVREQIELPVQEQLIVEYYSKK